MDNKTILIIDDTPSELFILKNRLEQWGYIPLSSNNGKDAIDMLKRYNVDLIISDFIMPEISGIQLLKIVKHLYEDIPFILLTAHGSIDNAVKAMKYGADDYITKTYNPEELHVIIQRSIKYHLLRQENKELKEYYGQLRGFKNIITRSPQMLNSIELSRKVAKSPATTVSIFGESGTGKELFARAIHSASGCMENRFVGINCAGIPSNLLESELFGHVKGAFTGAEKERTGKFGLAQNGTILLDEIGDMHLEVQSKFLRVLQERKYEMVGSDKQMSTNARIITATHRDIPSLVNTGHFRKDLFHRINSFPIQLFPLRERREDIPLLVDYFINKFRSELGKVIPGVSQAAMEILSMYDWPGNVRELKNCIERAAIINKGELIRPEHLTLRRRVERVEDNDADKININFTFDKSDFSLKKAVDHILDFALEKCENNKARAAKMLGIDRKMFYRRQKKR